jgi:Reverse transcriptase (RNA-dependent DNA polymerase)
MFTTSRTFEIRLQKYKKKVYKGDKGKGIHHIEIQEGPVWKIITDPVMTETLLLDRNVQHYGQAQIALFAKGPLYDKMTFTGISNTVENIVNGKDINVNLTGENQYTQAIITELQGEKKLDDMPNDITFEEFKAALIRWNERTTTSPSGRHLGHYKLLTRLPVFETPSSTINISQNILYVYYQMMMIAACSGNTLERWCNVSTCMIEKIKGQPIIDKVRIIHLYEADYNLLLKIVWARKADWKAHNSGKLYNGQAGSRPNCRAIEVVLHKEMKYTYARLTRTNLGTIDNDAKSCFDRILCNFAMLISRHYGVPFEFCSTQAKTLQLTRFRLRTVIGDSTRTYQHSKETPIHGTGQGSCASPAIWLLVSNFLMTLLAKIANGMRIEDIVKNNTSVIQIILAFVDDTSIFTNDDSDDIQKLKQKLQQDCI